MEWSVLRAALIRFGWTLILTYGAQLVAWGLESGNWETVGATGTAASVLAAVCYGVKKFIWPDTVL